MSQQLRWRHSLSAALGLLCALGCGDGRTAVTGTGGTPVTGSGGAGGAATGGAGGGDFDTCGPRSSGSNRFSVRASGPNASPSVAPGPAFEGPAVVERSTTDDLILYFEPERTKTGQGGAGGSSGPAAPPPGFHVSVSNWPPLPTLPAGAQVWLAKNPDTNQPQPGLVMGPEPFTLSIWDRQGGTLLLEATRGAPLARTPECTTLVKLCAPAPVTYYKVEVPADSPTVLSDNTQAIIQRAGRPYDAYVSSLTTPARIEPFPMCQDYRQTDLTTLDLKLRDLSDITFDKGTPPTCIPGNDPIANVLLWADQDYDGPVTYRGRDEYRLTFEGTGGEKVTMTPATGIPEPSLGQTFWFSRRYPMFVLRTSEQGDLVAAAFDLTGSAPALAPQALGVSFAVEKDCAYSAGATPQNTEYLQRVILGSTPPVTVRSGTEVQAVIGGRSYRVTNYRNRFAIR